MTTIVYDLETNGLLYDVTEIHCGVLYELETDKTYRYTSRKLKDSDGTIEDMIAHLQRADVLVAHNGINYDAPVIKKLHNVDLWDTCKMFDTLLASKLAYPNIIMIDSNSKRLGKLKGSHGLKSWGIRLKLLKGDFGEQEDAWDKLTPEMVKYCVRDVEVTTLLYKRIKAKGIPDEAMELEQNFARIIQRQEAYGWLFDIEKAKDLHIELLKEKEVAEAKLYEVFKPLPKWIPKNKAVEFKKNGDTTVNWDNQMELGCTYNDDLEWGYYKDEEFNPSSPIQRVKFIEHYFGKQKWVLNDKGNPKTGEEDLLRLFKDNPIAEPLVKYLNVSKLLGQLAEGKNAWLKQVKDDGRIHGGVDTLGAVSRRCTHSKPNVAQVPSNSAYKGEECRSLFTVASNKRLVGCDASGLELRVFAHFLANYDKGEYAKLILEGDIHTHNQKAAGLPTRNMAKTFIYGLLYGGGDQKIGEIISKGAEEGKRLKESFNKNVPAYKKLIDGVQNAVKTKGYLKALDGNRFFIRSPHSALNTLLQGTGALIMKRYNIIADNNFQREGWVPGINYEQTGSIHDECQWEVDEDKVSRFKEIAEESFKETTEALKFRILLEGEAKDGSSWLDTH